MHINKRLTVLASLTVIVFLASLPSYVNRLVLAQGSIAKNLAGYKNPTYRIQFQYPSNWTRIEPNKTSLRGNLNDVVMLKAPATSSINSSLASMTIQTYNGSDSFERFIYDDLFVNLNQPQLHFHIVSKNTTNLAGAQATEVIFTYQTPLSNRKVLKIYEQNGPQIYIVSYNADSLTFDYYLPTIQKIIHSIEIRK
jgi:hypothetical protein